MHKNVVGKEIQIKFIWYHVITCQNTFEPNRAGGGGSHKKVWLAYSSDIESKCTMVFTVNERVIVIMLYYCSQVCSLFKDQEKFANVSPGTENYS